MKSIAPLNFSHLIAYLLPGLVAFYALGYFSPRAASMMDATLSKDAGVGVCFMVLLFSLCAGIIVSAFRALTIDEIQKSISFEKINLDYSKLNDERKLEAFKEVLANTYRFAQFSGNMLVSILLILASKTYFTENWEWPMIVVLALTSVVLLFSHRAQLVQTYQDLGQVLK